MSVFSSQHHSFDIKLARLYGVDEAIMIHHFLHWIRINRLKNHNIRDGRCWTYQSRKDLNSVFPYWTFEQVKYLCEKLVEKNVLVTGNYNKSQMDRTLWYAFADEKLFGVDEDSINFYERENSLMNRENSLVYIKETDTRTTDIEKKEQKDGTTASASALSFFFLTKVKEKKSDYTKKICPSWIKSFSKLLNLRTIDQIKALIEFAFSHPFWFPYCLTPEKLLKHLDTLEVERAKDSSMKKPPGTCAEENKKLAQAIAKKFHHRVKSSEIIEGHDYIEFNLGARCPAIHLKFTEKGFREQALSGLRKIGESPEGL